MQFGTVAAIYRHPVKAMAAEVLDEAQLGWFGLPGDRRYAFVQSDHTGDFPWLTIRQLPQLVHYRPELAGDGERAPVTVTTPAGRRLALQDPELADELAGAYGAPVWLLRSQRGLFDSFAVSVISLQTVAALGELAGRHLDPRRFRANVVIDLAGGKPFAEDEWAGSLLRFGDGADGLTVRVNERDHRCAVINVDPATGERQPEVLRAVARHRDACTAVYASTERPGRIAVGDAVRLSPPV
jgi:uncharacterized protein YcbX